MHKGNINWTQWVVKKKKKEEEEEEVAVVGGSMKLGDRCAGKDPGGVEGMANGDISLYMCIKVSKNKDFKYKYFFKNLLKRWPIN